MQENRSARLQMITAMTIFGTIGIFVHYIPLPSSVIALARGTIGMLFLLIFCAIRKIKISGVAIRKKLGILCVSGLLLGINWILLFEAYRHTSVAVGTLCYYMAPIFMILISPVIFKERLYPKKLVCVLVALTGMVLVSGVIQNGMPAKGELTGILLGLLAAVCYAVIVVLNKFLGDVPAFTKTIVQLGVSAVTIFPYVLLTESVATLAFSAQTIVLLLCVGIFVTGVSYTLYFGSIQALPTQTIAIFSYIDPVLSILLSALILHEYMDLWQGVGAVLILGAALVSELSGKDV